MRRGTYLLKEDAGGYLLDMNRALAVGVRAEAMELAACGLGGVVGCASGASIMSTHMSKVSCAQQNLVRQTSQQ